MDAKLIKNPVNGVTLYWACGKCASIDVSQERAEACCAACDTCGGRLSLRSASMCEQCAARRVQLRIRKKLVDAVLVPWDDSIGMVWDCESEEIFSDPGEIESAFEKHRWPQYCFVMDRHVKEFDLESAIEQMEDDTYDEAEVERGDDFRFLKEVVDDFNSRNAIVYYLVNYKKKVRVPIETFEGDE